MNLLRKQRGQGFIGLLALIAIGVAVWYFWYKPSTPAVEVAQVAPATVVLANSVASQTPPVANTSNAVTAKPSTVAVAPTPAKNENAEEGWWNKWTAAGAGFLLGGWFVGALSLTAELFLFGVIGIPCLLMAILVEWTDPRVAWPWWEYEPEDRDVHEIWTSILFIVMLAVLMWGGVPIWSTFMEHPWVYSILYFFPVGLGWGCYRWDNFSKYLHKNLASARKGVLKEIAKQLEELLVARGNLRGLLTLDVTDKIPNSVGDAIALNTSCSGRDLERSYTERANAEYQLRVFLCVDADAQTTATSDEKLRQWIGELNVATKNEEDGEENLTIKQWLKQLIFGVTEKKPIRFPEEFIEYFKKQDKNAPKVSAKDHKGQIYLWTVFWPLSMSFRFVRWVITLKILRDIFNFMWNRLRFVYDRIAARHEVKFEVMERPKEETPSPAAAMDDGGQPLFDGDSAPNFGPAQRKGYIKKV